MAYTTIPKSSDYFNTKLYTGNATQGKAVTSGFATDFVWIKNRGSTDDHVLFDKIRGGTKYLYSNQTAAEATYSSQDVTFESTGVNVGSYTSINQNSGNIASWHWLANGAGVANTDGSISSTVSASATSGFSIVSYTGTGANATIGHGLGSVPKMIITKSTGAVAGWGVYHQSLGNTNALFLEESTATSASSVYWNNTSPTSSVFSVGSAGAMNNTNGMIAYCFAEKQGYSKFGTYTGNGNADGPFVYTGFKPAFVILKGSTIAESWWMYDNKRDPYNVTSHGLNPNTNGAEVNYPNTNQMNVDLLSNGFKLTASDGAVNGSGQTYIYMAFAEEPLVGDNPATAR